MRVNARLDEAHARKLDELCRRTGGSRTQVLRAAIDRFEQQASEHVQRLADDLDHLVSSRGMLIVRPIL